MIRSTVTVTGPRTAPAPPPSHDAATTPAAPHPTRRSDDPVNRAWLSFMMVSSADDAARNRDSRSRGRWSTINSAHPPARFLSATLASPTVSPTPDTRNGDPAAASAASIFRSTSTRQLSWTCPTGFWPVWNTRATAGSSVFRSPDTSWRAITIPATSAAPLSNSASASAGAGNTAATSSLGPVPAAAGPAVLGAAGRFRRFTCLSAIASAPASVTAACGFRGFVSGCACPAAIASAPALVGAAAAVHIARGPRAATYPPFARSFTVSPANNSSAPFAGRTGTGRAAPASAAARSSSAPGSPNTTATVFLGPYAALTAISGRICSAVGKSAAAIAAPGSRLSARTRAAASARSAPSSNNARTCPRTAASCAGESAVCRLTTTSTGPGFAKPRTNASAMAPSPARTTRIDDDFTS
ncbi:hypothetical protein GCM10009565_53070 [Amycolatopsis albidoflavus]